MASEYDAMKLLKFIFMVITGQLGALYLLNIGAGIFEFIPDNIPVVGNIDEAVAAVLLVNSLAYLGLDLNRFRYRTEQENGDRSAL